MATSTSRLRKVAMALPETTEQPHFDLVSWRVRDRIFATIPAEPGRLRVFVAETDVAEMVAADPAAYSAVRWGKRVAGVEADLRKADESDVVALLESAWRRKAPKRLVTSYDARNASG
jgi:hypothetical protein